ncbi:MAG: hypothetical protein E5V49_09755 [Mesorhizobium sp.]|nr:hypothetical protein EN848_05750 [bacterium M00.F.Ca.ET.205.01.1.1]TGU54113.1 hypothetical protein EN795_10165 [bacterium M00.F.Ca.ET.152.01.1.1]TGV37614.1 hypothetical protein EN829_010190 [Mesorhizobium sp. M00.F.Ca.ET.186.01.1.1]TGZ41767.1 hypothetical protein EN805_18260 [bacterium M00.F.Ca.ET.162.01.1.1]TIW60782.1 MAG: hypothetical protein E5V48_12195 [Mesorhizobium sp.]
MVAVIGGGLDTRSRDKPLRLLRLVHICRTGQPDVVAVFRLPDLARVYRMAIFVAAAIRLHNRVFLAGVPIVGVRVAR